jgi:VanZ family protein
MNPISPAAPDAAEPTRPRWPIVCLAGYWVVLFLATHWPNPFPPGGTPNYPDKLVHFTAYGILACLAIYALARTPVDGAWRLSVWRSLGVLAIVIAYGLFDETTQPLTGRDFEWKDWLADIGGSSSAAVLCGWIARLRTRQPT